jgi:hypothetical protein
LIVGDSTIKHLDKRRLLADQTISKCRAATISDACQKIRSGGSHQMENIIFCVGLNDLRNGNNVDLVVADMKRLTEETQYRHPRCSIYVCSILPVNTEKATKSTIGNVNSHFKHYPTYMDNVHFIDLLTAFTSHGPLSDLFEADCVHPNQKGTTLMMNIIRNHLQRENQPLRRFASKRANPGELSYTECAKLPPVKPQMNTI